MFLKLPLQTRSSLEERNASLNESSVRLREDLRSAEERKATLERELRQLQTEHADVSKRCSIAEASLEVANRVSWGSTPRLVST